MKVHRFIGNFDLSATQIAVTDTDVVHQMIRVLRLKEGERVVLCDGHGQEIEGPIATLGTRAVSVVAEERRENRSEPVRRVILACAVLKREHFDLVVQKATELGVAEIVPLLTRRTIKTDVNQGRLERIAREAAEQSGRGSVPVIHEPVSFSSWISRFSSNGSLFFCDFGGADFQGALDASLAAVVCIGPEGGWDEEERLGAEAAGARIVSLGRTVLRAETAACVAVYVAVHG